MADLVLDAQIDLEVNEADLQRSVDRAGKVIQDGGQRATRPSGGGGGGVGIGGVAIGTLIGNMMAGITRTIGRLLRALVNLPRQLIQFAKSLREFSPSMNRVFTIFERRMAMFRRGLGERLAPQIGTILDRIATFLEDNQDTIGSLLSRLLSVTIAMSKIIAQMALNFAGDVSTWIQDSRQGIAAITDITRAILNHLGGAGVIGTMPSGMPTPAGLMGLSPDDIANGIDRWAAGSGESPLGKDLKELKSLIATLVDSAKKRQEMTEQEKLEASNQRLVDMSAQANRFALDPITQFIGAAPSQMERQRSLRRRGIQ